MRMAAMLCTSICQAGNVRIMQLSVLLSFDITTTLLENRF